jgi:NADH dehydrogenase
MRPLSICVLGGTGFVGSHVVSRLVRDGHRVLVPTRNRARHRELLVLPGLELRDFDVHDAALLPDLLRGHDAVINLVGILNEGGGARFSRVHAELARTVAVACRSAGVPRLLHMSSLRADEAAPSAYLRSKGLGERHVREQAGPVAWTVFRASVIFGPGDGFLNKFASLLRLAPIVPLVRARTRFAPVYVGDVAEATARALADRATRGATLELCGPEVFTLADLVRYVGEISDRRRPVVPLPDAVGVLQAALLGLLPGKPLSLDNFRSLKLDSVCEHSGLSRLGIVPTSLRTIAPGYLGTAQRALRRDLNRRAAASRDSGA